MRAQERPTPYVGVSGVGTSDEHLAIRNFYNKAQLHESGRLLLLGVKGCSNQYADKPNKRGDIWYPVGEKISDVISDPSDFELPVIQTYFGKNSYDEIGLVTSATDLIVSRTSPWVHGFQYDMFPWTNDEHVEYLRRTKSVHPDWSIIVQCHSGLMDELGPQGITDALAKQSGIIDYALFDASHGEGIELSPTKLIRFVDAVYSDSRISTMNFGVAGGLHADNLELLLPILNDYPDISFDSEGKMHFQNGENGGQLKLDNVRRYLTKAAELLWSIDNKKPLV